MARLAWVLNALLVLILGVVLGGALYVQLVLQEQPCPLCLLQRLGMIGVAIGALLNLRSGAQMAHYGLSLLSTLSGGAVALYQTSVLALQGKSFGAAVFGLHLYTWSLLVFLSSLAGVGLLLLLGPFPGPAGRRGRAAVWLLGGLLLAITFTNILVTAQHCGAGLCWD